MNETRTAQQSDHYNDGINFLQLLKIITKHFVMIVFLTILAAGAGFSLAKYAITPQYTSSTQILVNQKHATANGDAFNNQQADIQMINTYKGIITNHRILSTAQKQLAHPIKSNQPAYRLSFKTLKKMVSVQTTQNSQLFELKVKAPDAREAAVISNTITDIFNARIKHIMGFNNITITSRAVVATKPSFPNVELFTIGGAILGMFIGIIIAVIKEVN